MYSFYYVLADIWILRYREAGGPHGGLSSDEMVFIRTWVQLFFV